jgi:hypothetical protein
MKKPTNNCNSVLPRFTTIISLTIIYLFHQLAFTKTSEVKMEPWFTNKNCQKLEIIKYQSLAEQKVVKSVSLQDAKFIEAFMARIEKIPANGDEMISFAGSAQSMELTFYCGQQKQLVEIYQGKFKTPSTGFNSSKNEHETSLFRDIDALLEPNYEKNLPKVKDLELQFKHFSITYKGQKDVSGEPATVSFTNEIYLVKDNKSNEQSLIVTSGQRPPAPMEFKIKGFLYSSKFTLITYETKTGERLYPNYFQIIK